MRSGWRAAAKRAFDIAGAGLALVVLSPVLLIAAIAIRLDSKGPIFFSQVRVGRDAKPFRVLKLRTMVVDAEQQLADAARPERGRRPALQDASTTRAITRVGRILRKTSIDELPQLWNVVRGDMSLVGPRPALPHETEAWDSLLIQRLRVKPGITGMWQVQGRSDASFEDYTRLDLYYVDNWSLTTDLAILAEDRPGGGAAARRVLSRRSRRCQTSSTTRSWSTRLSESGPSSVATTMSSSRRPQRPGV